VLHQWASTSGLRLDYPNSYLTVFQTIAAGMDDIDQRDTYGGMTPLHKLAVYYHPEDEVERACDVLFAHKKKPADVNATTRDESTALCIALHTEQNPQRRGLYFVDKGASLVCRNDRGRDIFYAVVYNQSLLDQQSHDLILHLLSRLTSREHGHNRTSSPGTEEGNGPDDDALKQYRALYEKYFLPSPGSIQSLWAAVQAGRLQTTRLLLDLGLSSRINDLADPKVRKVPQTTLDFALGSAEWARRWHMQLLSGYKLGAARERAYRDKAVYDPNRGGPARAAEAYWAMPAVIDLLLQRGARRAVDLDEVDEKTKARVLDEEFEHEVGSFWDVTVMYRYGFTPETQPHREHWRCLSDLARYPSDWEELVVAEVKEQYEYKDGLSRPHIRLLERTKQQPGEVTSVDRVLPKIIRMLASAGVPDAEDENSVWILASDGDTGEPRWEVEIVYGTTVGRKREIQQEPDFV
jgi:hypothetical protein